MKNIINLRYILILSTFFMFVSCSHECPDNYTSDIRSIMNPMKIQLKNFFENEQRYPNNTQRDRLLEASGCKIIDPVQRICSYKNMTFTYHSAKGIMYPEPSQNQNSQDSEHNNTTDIAPVEPEEAEGVSVYTFAIVKKNSHCSVSMTYQGKMTDIKCIQDSCIEL